jgi:DNA-binding beta-propeller fold protein YncE
MKLSTDGTVTDRFPVGDAPAGIAFFKGHIWVSNSGSNNLMELTREGSVVETFKTGSTPHGIAFDGTNIWVANAGSRKVLRLGLKPGVGEPGASASKTNSDQ